MNYPRLPSYPRPPSNRRCFGLTWQSSHNVFNWRALPISLSPSLSLSPPLSISLFPKYLSLSLFSLPSSTSLFPKSSINFLAREGEPDDGRQGWQWRQLGAAGSGARGSSGWRDSDERGRRDGGGIAAGEGDGTVVGEGDRTTAGVGWGGRCSSGAEDSDGRGWGHLVLDQVEALCLAANDHCLNGTTVARRRQPPSQHGQCSPRSGCAAPWTCWPPSASRCRR